MLLTVAALASCQGRGASAGSRNDDSLSFSDIVPRDSADSVLLRPRVVTGPTVLVFWLLAADSLPVPDQASVLDDLTYATDRVAALLARHEIQLVPTNADTVYVALPNRQQRPILLSGLDFPFGYVLVSPGEEERILVGVYSEEELLEELQVYFDLPADSSVTRTQFTT